MGERGSDVFKELISPARSRLCDHFRRPSDRLCALLLRYNDISGHCSLKLRPVTQTLSTHRFVSGVQLEAP